jgi:hypothetical protein
MTGRFFEKMRRLIENRGPGKESWGVQKVVLLVGAEEGEKSKANRGGKETQK